MIPKHIIKKAIEGGWRSGFVEGQAIAKHGDTLIPAMWQVYALDPLFWQSLGNQLDKDFEESQRPDFVSFDKWDWKLNAHQFFDLFLTGGDTEKFWNDIVKN